MITGQEYLDSLDDGRRVYFQGKRLDSVADHPRLATAARWIARSYDRFHSEDPSARSPLFTVPRSREDLAARIPLLREADTVVHTTFQCLLSLLTASSAVGKVDRAYKDRIDAYYQMATAEDWRLVECITDAKGNRSLAPAGQPDADSYLHVVEERSDGIVIRGAKLHITGAALAHELVIMPTKQMKPGEEPYAVACAVPVNTPGVTIVNTTYSPPPEAEDDYPFSRHENMPDGFVLLDEVVVPWERVFLCGEVRCSADFAHSLGLWERLGATSFMADEADIIVGLAELLAEANGLQSVSHIREKINGMIIYATMIRAGLEAALANVGTTEDGMVYPSELYTNTAKFYGAANYAQIVRDLHDIAGGAVVTAPSLADFDNPEVGELLDKYMATGPDTAGRYRAQLFHAVRDYTADAYGGWRTVTNVQSGGGLYAQRLVTRKHYDLNSATVKARRAAGLDGTA